MGLETHDADTLRQEVRARYAAHARARASGQGGCCGGDVSGADPITGNLYGDEAADAPSALAASLGCGNPTALLDLHPGESVLDLGSGGGLDVLLSARRVGPGGFVYGLDMTPEMLALAERHRQEQGVENVRFLQGYIEDVPLPHAAVDVVISNCVINLSADKGRVLREAFRVLRPGGRFAVSDMLVQGTLPVAVRTSLEAWAGCIAGALSEEEYRRLLAAAGFVDVEIAVTREYDPAIILGAAAREQTTRTTGRVVAAFVRARKP